MDNVDQYRMEEVQAIRRYFSEEVEKCTTAESKLLYYDKLVTIAEAVLLLTMTVSTALNAILLNDGIDKSIIFIMQCILSVVGAITLSIKGFRLRLQTAIDKQRKQKQLAQSSQDLEIQRTGNALEDGLISAEEFSSIQNLKKTYRDKIQN